MRAAVETNPEAWGCWEGCQSPTVWRLVGGEGLNGKSPVVACPTAGAPLVNPREPLTPESIGGEAALPVHGFAEVATFQKTWSIE